MMLKAFIPKYPERQIELEALQVDCQTKVLTGKEWNTKKECTRAVIIHATSEAYLKERASLSQFFDYWNT